MQVKFRLKDGLPDSSHKFVIVKRNNKYEMERVGAKGENEPTEQTFNLTPVNPKSTTATTHVSIHLDPKPINVAPRGSVSRDSIPIYDSTKIPDVDLRFVVLFIHTYIHTYIRTYVRTYIHTYIHTYIYTYIHVYIDFLHIILQAIWTN